MVVALTPLGAPIYPAPDAAARLGREGFALHGPLYAFALEAVRAAPPERRGIVADRFQQPWPAAVPIPSIDPERAISKAGALPDAILRAIQGIAGWPARAEWFRAYLASQFRGVGYSLERVQLAQGLIAMVLESLGEQAIDCLPAAAYYGVMPHPGWRQAALEFIRPHADTWWADWCRGQVEYHYLTRLTIETGQAIRNFEEAVRCT